MLYIENKGFDQPINRYTRAQILWVAETNAWKNKQMNPKGKGTKNTSNLGSDNVKPMFHGTAEDLAHIMYPKMMAEQARERDEELAVAKKIVTQWEAEQKKRTRSGNF